MKKTAHETKFQQLNLSYTETMNFRLECITLHLNGHHLFTS